MTQLAELVLSICQPVGERDRRWSIDLLTQAIEEATRDQGIHAETILEGAHQARASADRTNGPGSAINSFDYLAKTVNRLARAASSDQFTNQTWTGGQSHAGQRWPESSEQLS